MKKNMMNIMKMFQNPKFLLVLAIGIVVYLIYSGNILDLCNKEEVVLKEKIVNVEKFTPQSVSYDTKQAKHYEKELNEIQEKNKKTHKKGALYLKHTVSDTFDVEKDPHNYAGWSKYYKLYNKDTLTHDKESGENLKDVCHPVLKFDGIHRI